MDRNKNQIGNAGEFFVAAELERRGYNATTLLKNVADYDIIANDPRTGKCYNIQVKTTSGKTKKWTLSPKNEVVKDPNLIYVFVSLNGLEYPSYHIVPAQVVATHIHQGYVDWLNSPSKKGKPHDPNSSFRHFLDKDNVYLNNWNLLS